jgi:hypothetical protein
MSALKCVAIALLLALPSKCKMSSYVPWSPIPSAAMSTTITSPSAAGEWDGKRPFVLYVIRRRSAVGVKKNGRGEIVHFAQTAA